MVWLVIGLVIGTVLALAAGTAAASMLYGLKPSDPLTLYIYSGADAEFTLYEDDGLTFGYEKGAFAEIPLHWDDRAHSLTIGDRKGSYPGMLSSRRLQIVLITPEHPVAFPATPVVSANVSYAGKRIAISVR